MNEEMTCEELHKEYLVLREKTELRAQVKKADGTYGPIKYIAPEDMQLKSKLKEKLLETCEDYIENLNPSAKWDFKNVS